MFSFFFGGESDSDDDDDIIQERIFEIQHMIKRMVHSTKKSRTMQLKELKKTKKLINEGNFELANISASNLIREKTSMMRVFKTISRLEGIKSLLKDAQSTSVISDAMSKTMGIIGDLTSSNDIMHVVETFEDQVTDLEVQSGVINTMLDDQAVATSVPEEEVSTLLNWITDTESFNSKTVIPTHSDMTSCRDGVDDLPSVPKHKVRD